MGRVGVEHHQFGERVVLQFGLEVESLDAVQVVEPVAVLQVFELVLEHEVKGRAEHAAEGHFFLGQAADPEVDGAETGGRDTVQVLGMGGISRQIARPGTSAVEEVKPVGRHDAIPVLINAEDEFHGRYTLVSHRRCAGDGGMRAIGRNEVDQRFRVLQVLHQIDPAGVGLELTVTGAVIELTTRRVQGRDAGIAAAREVEGGKVERQTQQVVAHRFGDELVDLVADLAGQAAHDGAGGLLRGRAAGCKRQRIQERLNQANLAGDKVGVQPVNRLDQHRVAEAVDRVRELGHDRRIDRGIEVKEDVDLRLNGAGELFEHEMLVLHLGAELGRLEQALAVPLQGRDLGCRRWQRRQLGIGHQPLVQEVDIVGGNGHILGVLHEPVVLGVEDGVDGGQADVFVDPAVTGDVMGVKQLVVVKAGRRRAASDGVGVRQQAGRHGIVRNVDEELMAGAHGVDQADWRGQITLNEKIISGIRNAIGALHHDHR